MVKDITEDITEKVVALAVNLAEEAAAGNDILASRENPENEKKFQEFLEAVKGCVIQRCITAIRQSRSQVGEVHDGQVCQPRTFPKGDFKGRSAQDSCTPGPQRAC